jgi:hypothetical protein
MQGGIILSRGRLMFGGLYGFIKVRLLPPLVAYLERGALVQLGIKLGQLIASYPVPVLLRHELNHLPHCKCAPALHLRAS